METFVSADEVFDLTPLAELKTSLGAARCLQNDCAGCSQVALDGFLTDTEAVSHLLFVQHTALYQHLLDIEYTVQSTLRTVHSPSLLIVTQHNYRCNSLCEVLSFHRIQKNFCLFCTTPVYKKWTVPCPSPKSKK